MAMYCKNCGARTDIRKANCPVCRADQRKRRFAFFSLIVLSLVCVTLVGLTWGHWLRHAPDGSADLTEPAAMTAAATTTTLPPGEDTVYVTASGTKYHRDGCSHLSDTKEAIALSEALRMGYTPCADCYGDE